jgi:hypothetical protein
LGPERQFDFSRAALAERWKAGYLDMAEAVRLTDNGRQSRRDGGVQLSVW